MRFLLASDRLLDALGLQHAGIAGALHHGADQLVDIGIGMRGCRHGAGPAREHRGIVVADVEIRAAQIRPRLRELLIEEAEHLGRALLRLALDGGLLAFAIDELLDRKSTRLNSSHSQISYAVFCLKKK